MPAGHDAEPLGILGGRFGGIPALDLDQDDLESVSALQPAARRAVILTDCDQVNDASRLTATRPGELQEVLFWERRALYSVTNPPLGHGHGPLCGVACLLETLLVVWTLHYFRWIGHHSSLKGNEPGPLPRPPAARPAADELQSESSKEEPQSQAR